MQTDGQSQADQACMREGASCSRARLWHRRVLRCVLCCAVLRRVACVIEYNGRVAGRRHSLPQLKHPLELIHPYSLAEESGELINAYLPLPFHLSRLQFIYAFFHFSILPLSSRVSSSLVDLPGTPESDATHTRQRPAMSTTAKLPSLAPK